MRRTGKHTMKYWLDRELTYGHKPETQPDGKVHRQGLDGIETHIWHRYQDRLILRDRWTVYSFDLLQASSDEKQDIAQEVILIALGQLAVFHKYPAMDYDTFKTRLFYAISSAIWKRVNRKIDGTLYGNLVSSPDEPECDTSPESIESVLARQNVPPRLRLLATMAATGADRSTIASTMHCDKSTVTKYLAQLRQYFTQDVIEKKMIRILDKSASKAKRKLINA